MRRGGSRGSKAACERCGHGDTLSVAEWLEGPPERTFWIGLKTKGRDKFAIRTFRCTHCGYLETYANP